MGIKGLKQFFRNKFPFVLCTSHLSQYRGKKAGLDLLPYLYKYKSSYGETWIYGLSHLFQMCIINKIHITVIMDGPMIVTEKDNEKEKRKKSRNVIKEKINQLEIDIELYKKDGKSTILLDSVYSKISTHRSLLLGLTHSISVEAIYEYIETLKKQLVVITNEDITQVQELCNKLHITFVFAKQEAESYASYLCISKQVDMVITEDTDVLAYGCPLWLSSIQHDGTCIEIELSHLLTCIGFTQSQFIDFCILCGTDFNETKKGVGPVSAFNIIPTLTTWITQQSQEDLHKIKLDNTRTIFMNPCCDAIVNKFDTTIIKLIILFNDIPNYSIVFELVKKGYPLQQLYNWIKNYDSNFYLIE
jgi:5'-3' exonuclease